MDEEGTGLPVRTLRFGLIQALGTTMMRPTLVLVTATLAGLCFGCAPAGGGMKARAPQTSVPFEFPRNQILVQVRIAGRGPFSCTVDTGANPSVIDLSLAESIGLQLSAEAGLAEGVGTDSVRVYQTRFDVTLGDAPTSSITSVALDLSSLSAAFGQPLHCVLGQSWLAARAVQIDYPARRLRVGATMPQAPMESKCDEFEMHFWMPDDLMPLVTVRINDIDLPVSLDTGSSGTLKLFPLGAQRAGISTPTGDSSHVVTGARGAASVKKIAFPSLVLGPLAASNVQGSIGDKNIDEPDGREGNLGNGFLGEGVLDLDYPARRIRVCAPPAVREHGGGGGT